MSKLSQRLLSAMVLGQRERERERADCCSTGIKNNTIKDDLIIYIFIIHISYLYCIIYHKYLYIFAYGEV